MHTCSKGRSGHRNLPLVPTLDNVSDTRLYMVYRSYGVLVAMVPARLMIRRQLVSSGHLAGMFLTFVVSIRGTGVKDQR